MNPFGDGSDGVLNVASGTTNLLLNRKYQYTSVNVANGAILTTSSSTGSVLYILATESITVDGSILLNNKLINGQFVSSVTIDGVAYTAPGVMNGGRGGDSSQGATGGSQSLGFGGGGAGGSSGLAGGKGGNGGNGGSVPQNGGSSVTANGSGIGITLVSGNNGGNSAGGSGLAYAIAGTATSGAGGNAYGSNGGGASGGSSDRGASGGGGAGGIAGKSGIHLVLKAPVISITGTINTSGTNGGDGGVGGAGSGSGGYSGASGGGGGGGNAGTIRIVYSESINNAGSIALSGGSGGSGNTNGTNGSTGTLSVVSIAPVASFTATPTSGSRILNVVFNNSSTNAISYLWNFGDGTTSTDFNPSHQYENAGNYTVTLTASSIVGEDTVTKPNYIAVTYAPVTFSRAISGALIFGGSLSRKLLAVREIQGKLLFGGSVRSVVLKNVEGIQDKRYLYKVYDPDGNYIEVWKDVISDLTFTHEINTIGSSATVELARNSDTVGVDVEPLLTESGQNILTEDNLNILASVESKNQIGSGSSVDYNNRVDVTVFYGSVEPLYTEDMESIFTEDDEELLADIGAPNGRRIFTGFISEINSRYGNSETTIVQLTSYGWDLDQFPITTSDGKTTVPFLSKDPSQIAKDAVDKFMADSSAYGTYTTRDSLSIDDTGTVVSYTFRANTYKDVLEKTLELMPSNWYYRIGLGDNLVYYKERSATPQHLFYLGKHIKSLDLKGSIINSTNRVLFTGGGEPSLYIDRSEAPADRTRRTLKMMSDNRVTVLDSAEIIADGAIDGSNKRLFRTTVEILTKQYDIESINVGETVGFRNFGNEVDTFTMQILGLTYSPDSVQLQLETKPPTVSKRLQDISRNLLVNENQNLPDAPL